MELVSSATSRTATPVPLTALPCVLPATPSTLSATDLAPKIAQPTAQPAPPVELPQLAPLAILTSMSTVMEDALSAAMFLSARLVVLPVHQLASLAPLDSSRTTECARLARLTALPAPPTLSALLLPRNTPLATSFTRCPMARPCWQPAIQDAAVAQAPTQQPA